MAHADIMTTGDVAKVLAIAPRGAAKFLDTNQIPGTYRIPGSQDRRVTVNGFNQYILALPEPTRTTLYGRLNEWRTERNRVVRMRAESAARRKAEKALQREGVAS